jgi:hypothetical protein
MAATLVTHVPATPGTGTSFTVTITVSGANPALGIGISLNTASLVVSSVVSDVDGALSEIKNKTQASPSVFTSVWGKAAPTAGVHVLTVTPSGSVAFQADAFVYQGAHQTTPFPSADAVTGEDQSLTALLTPGNLVAGDASWGCWGSNAGNPTSVTPHQCYLGDTTAINLESGDATNTTGVTFNGDAGWDGSGVAVRIAQAGGGGPSAPFPPFPSTFPPALLAM